MLSAPAPSDAVAAGTGTICSRCRAPSVPLVRKRTVLPVRGVRSGSETQFAALPFVIAFEAKIIVAQVGVAERQVTRHREDSLRKQAM